MPNCIVRGLTGSIIACALAALLFGLEARAALAQQINSMQQYKGVPQSAAPQPNGTAQPYETGQQYLPSVPPNYVPSVAQEYPPSPGPRNYSGLMSGMEAWRLNDIRRRAEIGRQFDLNTDMYWRWSGAGSYLPGAFEPWPMVPGSIWGWPATPHQPVFTPTRSWNIDRDAQGSAVIWQEDTGVPVGAPQIVPAPGMVSGPAANGPREF